MPATLELLEVEVSEGVRAITIHHKHPACVLTLDLARELATAIDEAEADDATRVIVFRSADPDFFIAHFDVSEILKWAAGDFSSGDHSFSDARVQSVRDGASRQEVRPSSSERLRTSSKVSIAEIAGRAGGGGNEFCSGCDMRFGLAGVTKFNQMEVPLGILPGGTGTINLPKLIGRGRALEVILGAVDIDAETAERWGYLNRIFPSREALSAHVDALARRIASFPTTAVARAKESVLHSLAVSQEEALNHEYLLFAETLKDPVSMKLMTAFLEECGGQTREGELKVGELAPYLPFSSL
jgi:enoyl-CoA hydratase/carnithine racemase